MLKVHPFVPCCVVLPAFEIKNSTQYFISLAGLYLSLLPLRASFLLEGRNLERVPT